MTSSYKTNDVLLKGTEQLALQASLEAATKAQTKLNVILSEIMESRGYDPKNTLLIPTGLNSGLVQFQVTDPPPAPASDDDNSTEAPAE